MKAYGIFRIEESFINPEVYSLWRGTEVLSYGHNSVEAEQLLEQIVYKKKQLLNELLMDLETAELSSENGLFDLNIRAAALAKIPKLKADISALKKEIGVV